MRHFKKYWWILVLTVAIPIIINTILSISTPFKVYENQWLGFWGTYLGALFPFIILYITINDNRRENDRNRKIQTAIIEYQVSKERLSTLKKTLAEYINSLHVFELGIIPFVYKDSKSLSIRKITDIIKEVSASFKLLELELVDYDDETEQEMKLFLNKFNLEFSKLLTDISWYIDHKDGITEEATINTFHNNEILTNTIYNEEKRIWKIIEDKKYSMKDDGFAILNDLLDKFGFEEIHSRTKSFIKYENEKIKAELNSAHD